MPNDVDPIEDRLDDEARGFYADNAPEFVTILRSTATEAVKELRRLRRIVQRREANDADRPLLVRQ